MKMEKNEAMTNWYWVVGVLVVINIILFTYCINEKVLIAYEVIDYISSAGLFLSIVLSVVAIQYTYSSNLQSTHHFERINKAADRMDDTGKEIKEAISKIQPKIDEILREQDKTNTMLTSNTMNSAVKGDALNVANTIQ